MNITTKESDILLALGEQYMTAASLPVQKEKIKLWRALNRGEMQRPMVCIDQLPMHELNANGELSCTVSDPFWRNIEFGLRFALYRWNHFPADMVLNPFIEIPKAVTNSQYGIRPDDEAMALDEANTGTMSHQYTNQIETMEDVLKIKDMVITHDEKQSALRLETAEKIFKGLPVRLGGGAGFHVGVWDFLAMLISVEEVYYMLADSPEILHAAMERITQSVLAGIKQANELGVINNTHNECHCSHIFTDELMPAPGESKGAHSKNVWAFGMAQLFSSCPPSVTEEFELPYVSKIAEQFGMMYYGCCERLDDRLDIVKRIPNLKKVSCSPWSNKQAFAEQIGTKLVMSNKPNPAFLAGESIDYGVIENDLRETVKIAKANNANLEFILKDISTVQYDVGRIEKFNEIAMRVVSE